MWLGLIGTLMVARLEVLTPAAPADTSPNPMINDMRMNE